MSQLVGKVDIEVEIKASARAFYEVHTERLYDSPKLCPHYIPRVDLVEGGWRDVGSVMDWYLLWEGKTVISKEIYEHKDDEKLSVTFKVIGGLLMEAFKSFKFIIQATPKDKGGCLVRWTLEYEKLKEDVPDPKEMLNFAAELTKEMDANLIGH
ncbi:hypothetical protein F2P56_030920 [Juglans regia]|uniref:MLP-like protein 43 n=2 Tax=Juglans regia TaxID=51240 RepID=A0A2I4ENP9_JUGRE|nr:MLP-like protein 43 [Juglans regia]KAF5450585.1 hypothetical protein F2P56_030920 [Juglans regia]